MTGITMATRKGEVQDRIIRERLILYNGEKREGVSQRLGYEGETLKRWEKLLGQKGI